jgi:hypothetical protein
MPITLSWAIRSSAPISPPPYHHPEVEAAIVVSEDSAAYLRYVFPLLPVYRTVNAIDPHMFFPAPMRRRRLAFMTRRNLEDAVQIINILKFRGVLVWKD